MSLLPTSITIDPDTGYGFIDSTWGRVELDPHDMVRVTERIGTAIHEAEDAAFAEPLADTTCVRPSRDDSAAAARCAIEEFAAELRARSADITEHRPSRLHRVGTATETFHGTFHATVDDDAFYALFDRDGTITAGIDPARPVGSDEWVDTIAPLPNIEEI